MAPPSRCPACGGDLPPEAEACPNCPWSFRSEEHGVVPYHRRRGRDFSGPIQFFVVLGGIGWLAWLALNHVIEFAGRDGGSSRSIDAAADLQGKQVVDTSRVEAQAEPEPALIEIKSEEPRTPRAARGRKRPARAAQWRLRGAVYDLVSLKPVAGATVVLKDIELNRRIETTTDDRGRYRLSVPPLPGRGYTIHFDDPNYAPGAFLDPGSEGLSGKPRSERERLARELARSVMAPQSLQAEDDRPLEKNFYLAPKSLR